MRYISNKRRIKEKRCTGEGADYSPWLKTTEVRSQGTRSKEIDYKTGRIVHLMSMTELYFWHLLRWDDAVEDIKEQYALDNTCTTAIAEALRMMHPGGSDGVMTTDFLVVYKDGTENAFSVKNSKRVLEDPRTCEKLYMEAMYWKLKGTKFFMLWGEDLNMIMVNNIMDVVRVRNLEDVMDDIGVIKYMLSNKIICVDMEKQKLDYVQLLKIYKETEEFKWIKKKAEEAKASQILPVDLCR